MKPQEQLNRFTSLVTEVAEMKARLEAKTKEMEEVRASLMAALEQAPSPSTASAEKKPARKHYSTKAETYSSVLEIAKKAGRPIKASDVVAAFKSQGKEMSMAAAFTRLVRAATPSHKSFCLVRIDKERFVPRNAWSSPPPLPPPTAATAPADCGPPPSASPSSLPLFLPQAPSTTAFPQIPAPPPEMPNRKGPSRSNDNGRY